VFVDNSDRRHVSCGVVRAPHVCADWRPMSLRDGWERLKIAELGTASSVLPALRHRNFAATRVLVAASPGWVWPPRRTMPLASESAWLVARMHNVVTLDLELWSLDPSSLRELVTL